MPILVSGVSHKTASIDVREQLSFSLDHVSDALKHLKQNLPQIKEAMLVSTCQRTEWYLYADEFISSEMLLKTLLCEEAKAHAYFLSGQDAIRHMLLVANGLDSSLLGETQILGQIKSAYITAKKSGFLGKHLEQAMQFIFSSAKKVRTKTLISQGTVSLPCTAMNLGRCVFSEIENPYVLLIGAGEMIQNMLNHLKTKRARIVIANRSFDKAQKLAEEYQAKAVQMDSVSQHLALADVVISATTSSSLVLTQEDLNMAFSARPSKPVFMVDMAVPRDIAPEAANAEKVFLYNIDDLHKVVQTNLNAREKESRKAKSLIEEQVELFFEKLQLDHAGKTISKIKKQFETFRHEALKQGFMRLNQSMCVHKILLETFQTMESGFFELFGEVHDQSEAFRYHLSTQARSQLNLGKTPEEVLSKATYRFMNQLLHRPILAIKQDRTSIVMPV